MSIIYFLVLVGVLVVIHELGHFAAAKLLDVKVIRFSLGYGRPLVRVKLRETEYQLAVFPLGGYVRILGVDPGASDSPKASDSPNKLDSGRSFASRPLWQRLLIGAAGPRRRDVRAFRRAGRRDRRAVAGRARRSAHARSRDQHRRPARAQLERPAASPRQARAALEHRVLPRQRAAGRAADRAALA